MPWLRVSDTVASDPRTLAPLDLEDVEDHTVDEVFGFSVRLAAEAGSKETDGHVTRGMVRALAGSPARAARLMGMLVTAKVWAPTENGWRLCNDSGYLHLRAQDEIERDRIRGKDEGNDTLTVHARLRDGDQCRYCRKTVNWKDRRSLRGATWEHVNIANQPTQLHEFVVCCFECNRAPSNRPDLKAPPAKPVYGEETKLFVKKKRGTWPTRAQIAELLLSQRTPEDTATGHQRTDEEIAPTGKRTSPEIAVDGQRPDGEIAAQQRRQRPEEASENAAATSSHERQKRPSDGDLPTGGIGNLDSPGRVGTSSSGSSHAGTGGDGSASGTEGSPTSRRSKRGRRSKPSGEEQA